MATIRLLGHATLLIDIDGTTRMVDPMVSEPGEIPPIPNSPNGRDNPLVPLPDAELSVDAVLVTHRHRDHFADAAAAQLPADGPIYCQPTDADEFREKGFSSVTPVEETASIDDVDVHRSPASHGHGDLAERMGPASGYVLDGTTRIYLAGDTVWDAAVPETNDPMSRTHLSSTPVPPGLSKVGRSRWIRPASGRSGSTFPTACR